MPKPELGTKRTCLACGARFYDFGKTVDLACPACGAAFDLEQVARARRPRNPVRALAGAAKPAVVEADEDEVDETVEADEVDEDVDEDVEEVDDSDTEADEPDVPVADDEEEDDDPLIESAEELGDDDALGEVIDPESGEDDDRR